jgi:sulfur carrier protein
MEIILNDSIKEVGAGTTVQQLMDNIHGDRQNGIAVAVNETVVPKKEWNSHLLNEKDSILIIKATQGG